MRVLAKGWGPELLVLISVGFIVPVLIASYYGSISAPVSDDWAYDLAAFHLASHGGIDLYNWGTINLVGQLFLALPVILAFGSHIWVLNIWTCVIGLAGLVAVNYLGRQLQLSRRQALFVAVLMGAGPMWAVLSTSFMTDVQSVAVMAIALAVAAGDRRTDRIVTSRTVLALGLAGLAFTIREPTGVAFAAIALSRMGRCGRPSLLTAVPWAAIVAAITSTLLIFYIWRRALPSGSAEIPAHPDGSLLGNYWFDEWLFPLLGLMMAPVAVLMDPVDILRRALRTSRLGLLIGWMVMPILPVVIYVAAGIGTVSRLGSGVSALIWNLTPQFGNSFFSPGGLPDQTSSYDFLPESVRWFLAMIAIRIYARRGRGYCLRHPPLVTSGTPPS